MITAQDVADYIIWSSHEAGSFISNLKLQKLLYYVQAWHLAVFRRPLFPEKFQAWIRGPAIPEIYQRYQGYRWRNIDEEVKPPDLDARTVGFIEEVLTEYGPMDARLLEQLACREDPWVLAREGIAEDEPSTAVIDEETMGNYYRQRLSEAEIDEMPRDMGEGAAGDRAEVPGPAVGGDLPVLGREMTSGSGDNSPGKARAESGRAAG
jgi:uncharacterized phage-associated protein